MRRILSYTILGLTIIYFASCAKMGSIVGGPKDIAPPIVLASSPSNYSLNFDKRKIEITFNEFIILKDISKQLVVSPPLKKTPIVRLKNKSILIELESELRENTTYTINFGEAIADNNEGNVLLNYEFVFSTGDYLDSLSVGGRLRNAFDLKPIEESVHIMLYDILSDSIVFNEIPIYIGKTDKAGNFRINNLKADTFKIFALKDVNNNFLFDLYNEEIAFLEEPLNVNPEFFLKVITESLDSTGYLYDTDSLVVFSSDTIKIFDSDSLTRKPLIKIPDQLVVDLYLFQEENQQQYLNENKRKERNKLEFSFSRPVSDSFFVSSLLPKRDDWILKEETINRDTFVYWIIDREVREMDSIQLELNYVIQDSMKENVWIKDSLYFVFREPQKTGKKKADEEKETETAAMTLSGLKNKSTLELNTNLKLISETPINYIDTSKIEFYSIKDTIKIRENYEINIDSTHLRKIQFLKKWEPNARYRLVLYPGAVMNVFGATTDTLDLTFNIRDSEYYGVLNIAVDSLFYPAILQLLDNKSKLIREAVVDKNEAVHFEYLAPGKYKIKLFEDKNTNGKWDTGKYLENRQPEKVYFYNGEIEIRANWDLDIKVNKETTQQPLENVVSPVDNSVSN